MQRAIEAVNIDVINYARENGIVMLCFPPHCTHHLQPLDVSFVAPLCAYYSQEQKTWLRNNPGRVITHFQICKLFGIAYEKAATLQTAASGFRKTGIYPTNFNVFGEADFVAAETTEREQNVDENSQATNNVNPSAEEHSSDIRQPEGQPDNVIHEDEEDRVRPITPQPGPSENGRFCPSAWPVLPPTMGVKSDKFGNPSLPYVKLHLPIQRSRMRTTYYRAGRSLGTSEKIGQWRRYAGD
ncbi:hypothetical protein NQ318_009519 [Aromia moschata]|uniref:DDE-1 domain-containing protein n=1 Tax=Aromia moschata TaxID=1265417 RepID=A0AAV8Z7L1_9CUCU|nr:hypothetical protein NQ318_009519 [Aromia moschata]